MLNVQDLPADLITAGYQNAHGNGVDDDQPRLWPLIRDRLGALYFPPGRYRLNSTLRIPKENGHHWVGCGMAKPVVDQSTPQGAESVFIWGGADNGTMIKYEGVGMVWSGLSLWGCALGGSSSSCPTARAGYGIEVNKPSLGGVGTGKAWFESILIAHCKNAIGTTIPINLNCDTLTFGYCWFQDCEVGLRLGHQQSLQYTFEYVRAVDVDTIFQVDQDATISDPPPSGGGRIFTQAVGVESSLTTVLKLQAGGSNSAFHQIGGVVVSEGADNTTLLLSDKPPKGGSHHVRFTDCHLRNTGFITVNRKNGVPAGVTTVELVGCRGVGGLIGASDGNVLLRGGNSTNRIVFFVRDCDVESVVPLITTSGTTPSVNYKAWGLDNWTFASGMATPVTSTQG